MLEQVADSVYVGRGYHEARLGFVATPRGVVMIDAPLLPTAARKWQQVVEEHGPIHYLIPTDPHRSHAVGGAFFPGILIVHKSVRRKLALSEKATEQLRDFLAQADPKGLSLARSYQPKLPGLTFSRQLTLHSDGLTIRLLHMPGHTPHNVVVQIPERGVIFAGDNLVNGFHPFLGSGHTKSWLEALERIQALEGEVIVPGHGEVCGKEALNEMAAYIRSVRAEVSQALDQGLTKEEVLAGLSTFQYLPTDARKRKEQRRIYRSSLSRVYDELRQEKAGAGPSPSFPTSGV